MAEEHTSNRKGLVLLLLLPIVLFVLIPYGYSYATGTADVEMTGLSRIHNAAESVFCLPGRTPVTNILVGQLAFIFVAYLVARIFVKRSSSAASPLQLHGWYLIVLLVLIAMPFFMAWQTDSSVCSRGKAFFWQSIFVDVFILAILAISYNLMFGYTGVVSFGHALFFGLGAYTVGLLMLHASFPWWLAILAALVVGVVVALIKGFVGLRIKGLYFALFTLAFAEVFFILAGNRVLADITGAEDGFTFPVPDWLNMTKNRLFFYYLALFAFVLAFLVVYRLVNSPTGRVLHALRDNEERAKMLGYNTFQIKLIAIITAGILAAGAGVLRGLALKGASPNVLGLDFTINPLLMVIIGGLGTFAGPVIGAFGLRLTEQYLRDTVVNVGGMEINIGERWALILGLIFILSVMIFPHGIVGTWRSKGLNTIDGWRRLFRISGSQSSSTSEK
jgi:branched-chain amino acid transport system permease protein